MYIFTHIFACTQIYPLESFVRILLCEESTSLLPLMQNSHLLCWGFFFYAEMFWLLSPCCILWHMWRRCLEELCNIPGWTRQYLQIPLAYLCGKPGDCARRSVPKLQSSETSVEGFKQFCALPPKCVFIFLHLHTWQYFSPTFAAVFWVRLVYFFPWCTFYVKNRTYHFPYILLLLSPAPKPHSPQLKCLEGAWTTGFSIFSLPDSAVVAGVQNTICQVSDAQHKIAEVFRKRAFDTNRYSPIPHVFEILMRCQRCKRIGDATLPGALFKNKIDAMWLWLWLCTWSPGFEGDVLD